MAEQIVIDSVENPIAHVCCVPTIDDRLEYVCMFNINCEVIYYYNKSYYYTYTVTSILV